MNIGQLLAIGVFGIAIAPIVAVVLRVRVGRLSKLDGAAFLVLWGLFIVAVEHATFGSSGFGGFDLRTHTGFHYQMLAAYGMAAFALVAVVVAPLIRRGHQLGWYGLLILVLIGAGAEVVTAAVTAPHGIPQLAEGDSRGVFLWGYPVAWATSLIVSFRPVFHPETVSADRARDPDG